MDSLEGPCFLAGFMIGAIVVMSIAGWLDYQPSITYKKSAIEAGVGRYDEKTAKFEWIKPEKAEQ